MKSARALFLILGGFLCAAAFAAPGYRLVPLDDGSAGTMVFDLNRRGELVGMRSVNGQTHAFLWRAGTFTDLHDTIDPASTYTQAAGLNDRTTIVGDDFPGESFVGFLLRGSQVSPVTVVAGETQVFPFDINNRGQMLVDSVAGGQESSYLKQGENVQPLGGLPGEPDSMHGVAINERGMIAGYTSTTAGTRAVLWQDGTILNLGVAPGAESSFADGLNDQGQVVGFVNVGGSSHAMRWRDGNMAQLPKLAGEAASTAQSVNNWGAIVGGTTILQPLYRSTATVWLGNQVAELDSLISASDPRKPYVHLESGQKINDRGDIVASGVDSRTNARITYFLTLFDN